MTSIRTIRSVFPLALLLPALCLAQGSAQTDDVARLRDQIAAQQKQIDQQRQAIESAQKALASTQQALDAQQKLLDRLVAAQSAPLAVPPVQTAPPASQLDPKGRALSPLAFHIGGADFTPGGFLDFSNVWRSTNVGTGIVTSFGAIPFNNSSAGRLGEMRSSAQNSRITLKVTENPTKNLTVTGYIEGDFWGTQPVNGYVTSNSNTLRMRQYWVNVQQGKWEVMGGQPWTLLTPNRVGLSSVPADLFIGLGQDSNYQLGLVWGRSGQLRVIYHPDKKWSIAASLESPEQYVTAATTLPAFATTQVSNGTTTSTPNVRPDIIAKVAYDTKVSARAFHLELAGLNRQFRTSPAANQYFGKEAFGGSFNGVLEAAKNFRLIFTSFYSSGGGRYIIGLGPDLTVGPDGSISPVHSFAGIGGFEYQATPESGIYGYYGFTHFSRNYTVVSPGNYLGFGFPGSSSAANRQIQEPTFGYIRTFWKNPNYGSLQIFTQYSYVTRAPWYVAAGTPSTAHLHMGFAGLRFNLP